MSEQLTSRAPTPAMLCSFSDDIKEGMHEVNSA